jgi:Family of unknown function (DUF5719)
MSDLRLGGLSRRGSRALTLGAALLGVLLLLGAGMLFGAETPVSNANRVPLVGRTTTICPAPGEPAGKTEVSAVAIREASDRPGLLTASPLGSKQTDLKITQQGKGDVLDVPPKATEPILVAGEGAMATTGSSVIVSDVTEGPEASLSAAPCLAPGTLHWLSGLGVTDDDSTDLILINPDDAQAQVDLRFYGPSGRLVVPGSADLEIGAHKTLPVSLSTRVQQAEGPISVAVQASQGRVTAVAERVQTDQGKPAGIDWQVPSASPSTTVVIPAIPGDPGPRQLVVTNPGEARASVGVQVLGFQGAYEPSGAGSLDVAPESTATVSLADGLDEAAGSIKLTSNVPVTGAVVSTSQRGGAASDLAVQSAAVPLIGTGVSAVATSDIGDGQLDSQLIVSNAAETDVQITFEVLSYDGVTLRTGDIVLGPNSTATRRLNSPARSYVIVEVPNGSSVFGGLVLTQPDRRDVAGLATIPLGSPDLASRAPATRRDYTVGR